MTLATSKCEKMLKKVASQLRCQSQAGMTSQDIMTELRGIYFYNEPERIHDLAIKLSYALPESDKAIIELKKWIKNITIHASKQTLGELTEYGDTPEKVRKRIFGHLRVSNFQGESIDKVYQTIISSYPGYVDPYISNEADQLHEILRVITSQSKTLALNKGLVEGFKQQITSKLSRVRTSEDNWEIGSNVSTIQKSNNINCIITGVLKSFSVDATGLSYVIEADGKEYHCKDFDTTFIFKE